MIRNVIITYMEDGLKAETGLEIQRYAGTIQDRSRAWTTLEPGELRRRAVEAARDRDLETLWAITEAHLGLLGQPSVHTLRAYKTGLGVTLEALSGENVLRPTKNWGLRFIRELETGLKASSVRSRLASARALFAALRWAGASEAEPFSDVRVKADLESPDEKRQPYPLEVMDALLAVANPRDTVLVLLAAHGGLRNREECDLGWDEVFLDAQKIRVLNGKGGKNRTVSISLRLAQALTELGPAPGRKVLDLGPQGARAAMRRLCAKAGVTYQAVHSLRHQAGTRLYKQTGDLKAVAKHLGHSRLESSSIYAKFAEDSLKETVNNW
jgi:integrase